ncbi:hypothetical protein pb186bvf_008576 [Paramecium bursaria]
MIDDIPQLDGSNKSKVFQNGLQFQYRRYIARIVLFNVIVQVFMILYCAMILWGFDIKYLILYAWFLDLSGFLQLVVERSNGKFYTLLYFLEKLGKQRSLSLSILKFMDYFFFIFHLHKQSSPLLYLFYNFKSNFGQRKSIQLYLYMLKLLLFNDIKIQQMLYIIYLLQILVLTFKWNGLFNYSYYQVFIITWCIQAVNAFVVILLIVCCMENCYHVNNTRVSSNYLTEKKASVLTWIIFYFVGLSAIPFITLRNICDWYESKGSVSQQPLFVIIVCTQVYCILLGYQSYVVRDDIVNFLKNEYKTDIRDTITRQATQIQSQSQKSSSPRRWRRLRIPLLFLRISGSYFKLLGRKKTNSTSSKCTTMTVSQKYHDSQRPESLNQSPCITIKQLRSSEQEQKSLESCLVCFENEPDVILMPCQHGGICQQCADSIIEKTRQCYLCRNEIAVALKVVKRDSLLEAINVQKL